MTRDNWGRIITRRGNPQGSSSVGLYRLVRTPTGEGAGNPTTPALLFYHESKGEEEALDGLMQVKPVNIATSGSKHRRAKFQLGNRATANDKAPGSYEGRTGTIFDIVRYKRGFQYGVQFDVGEPATGYFDASWLDSA